MSPDPGPPSRASRVVVGGLALGVALGGLLGLCMLFLVLLAAGLPIWGVGALMLGVCLAISVGIRNVRRSAAR